MNKVIVRLEQLYSFATAKLREIRQRFGELTQFVWWQEESQNVGAWSDIEAQLRKLFGREIAAAVGNASAAVGALAVHKREQPGVIGEALACRSN